ncbi:MAG: hypothetical protein II839_03785, partial [Kiritimatiellae bacterium]|nr:hypothetical protein [Kiritimatiellia bacterium]
MKHPLILLSLFAATAAAAASWFDAGISDYESWPSDGSDLTVTGQGTWSGTEYATLDAEAHALSVAVPDDGRLVFEAATAADAAERLVAVEATMTFPDVRAPERLPDPTGVKFGLAPATAGGAAAFYGLALDPDADPATNRWVALSGATPP